MIFGLNLAIYTVFCKESESEVKKCQILEPGGKNGKTNVKSKFVIFYFFKLIFFLLASARTWGDVLGGVWEVFGSILRDFLEVKSVENYKKKL